MSSYSKRSPNTRQQITLDTVWLNKNVGSNDSAGGEEVNTCIKATDQKKKMMLVRSEQPLRTCLTCRANVFQMSKEHFQTLLECGHFAAPFGCFNI